MANIREKLLLRSVPHSAVTDLGYCNQSSDVDRSHQLQLTAVWMFGSTARGEDTVASDLDIAVVIDGSDYEMTAIAGEISSDLVTPGEWYGFQPSVVSICLKDIPKLEADGARLWRDLQADGRRIAGCSATPLMAG
jgi:hypothetical protein